MSSPKAKPLPVAALKWLELRLGVGVAAPLTGQDRRAFAVFIHALDLYQISDDEGRTGAILAMRGAIGAMQTKTRWIARESIPHVMNWADRSRIWPIVCPLPGTTGFETDHPRPMLVPRQEVIDEFMNDGLDASVEHSEACLVYSRRHGAYGTCSCGARS